MDFSSFKRHSLTSQLRGIGYSVGGINASGQVPFISGLPGMIDVTTPAAAKSRIGFDGATYNLVFSDEVSLSKTLSSRRSGSDIVTGFPTPTV